MGILRKMAGLEPVTLSGEPGEPSPGPALRLPLRSDRSAVTLRGAMSLPAAFRSIQITAGMAAELTLDVWRGDDKLDPTPSIIRRPDPWRNLSSWVERVVICLAGDGNAFLRKHTDESGRIVALEVLDPFKVTVRRDKRGRKFFDYTGYQRLVTFTADQVIHIWALEVPGDDRGLGPIGYCRASLEGAIDTRDYASDVFRRGEVSTGALLTDQHLEQPAMKEYQRIWREHDARDVRILAKGLKFQPVPISPKDAQWLESQTFSVLDVARMFGIPAPYLEVGVEGDAMTYQNLTQVDTKFLRTTLFPVYLRKIEAALTDVLPHGQLARFDTSALLRPDARTRMENHATAIENGIYGPEWARRIEGIPDTAAPRKDTAAA